ncbi:MAG: hypothetical protein R3C41_21035 [Calditrichia bacterium]
MILFNVAGFAKLQIKMQNFTPHQRSKRNDFNRENTDVDLQ